MPHQQILPTWLAWNNANFTSPTGITDLRTGQMFGAGGLGLGDYFDATEQEANSCSNAQIGLLHWGRYRLVQVDSTATPANVQTGMIGFARIGTFVQSVSIGSPGSGGTPGTYTLVLPPGLAGGSGAVLKVVIGSAGTITNAIVAQGGIGYSGPASALSFTPTGLPGISGETLNLQLNSTPNLVTSGDQAISEFAGGTINSLPRPIIFLNPITPGNFGFIQELGLATVMAMSGVTAGALVTANATQGLASQGGANVNGFTIGVAVDTVISANQLFKVYLNYVPVCQD